MIQDQPTLFAGEWSKNAAGHLNVSAQAACGSSQNHYLTSREIPTFSQNSDIGDDFCLAGANALKNRLALIVIGIAVDVLCWNSATDKEHNDVSAMSLVRRKNHYRLARLDQLDDLLHRQRAG